MKYKSIGISNYFELVKPQYVFFKLTPHSSCRNNSSDKLAQLVNKLYKTLANLEGKFITLKEASDRVNDNEN